MANSITIRVDGLAALGERMRGLSAKVANRVSGRATSRAASIVKKAAKDNIRRSPSIVTGSLLDAVIMKKLGKSQTSLTSEHIVTVRRRKTGRKTKTKQPTAPHASFVEFGTVNMPAEPYLRPALSRNIQPAIQAMKDALEAGIIKEGA